MTKFLHIIGYIFLAMFVFWLVLFIRYQTQSKEIHNSVDKFIEAASHGNAEGLKAILNPEDSAPIFSLIKENYALFSPISGVKENGWPFNYSYKSGIGETTTYNGKVSFNDGDEDRGIIINLIKYDGKWLVSGFYILPAETKK